MKAWLKRHLRLHIHYIPTSSSWLNVVERWLGKITQDRIRNGVFRSVEQLVDAIMSYVDAHNVDPTTFVWTKSGEEILQKTRRARAALYNGIGDYTVPLGGRFTSTTGTSAARVDYSGSPSTATQDNIQWQLLGSLIVDDRGLVQVRLTHEGGSCLKIAFDAIQLTVRDAQVNYVWDHQGWLLEVESKDVANSDVIKVEYGCDAQGRKIGWQETITSGRGVRSGGLAKASYIYDGNNVVLDLGERQRSDHSSELFLWCWCQ